MAGSPQPPRRGGLLSSFAEPSAGCGLQSGAIRARNSELRIVHCEASGFAADQKLFTAHFLLDEQVTTITIYTDGSALGNPGPGGYGVVMLSGPYRKELSQGFRLTTNNRMELMAVCVALETLKFEGSEATVYSDSKYVVDAVAKGWVFGWEKKGFAGKKNPDLWLRFLRVFRRHRVRFVWVKGHAETVENNRCDQLAVAAANDRAHLREDTGYVAGQ